jgi:hypothetical protein
MRCKQIAILFVLVVGCSSDDEESVVGAPAVDERAFARKVEATLITNYGVDKVRTEPFVSARTIDPKAISSWRVVGPCELRENADDDLVSTRGLAAGEVTVTSPWHVLSLPIKDCDESCRELWKQNDPIQIELAGGEEIPSFKREIKVATQVRMTGPPLFNGSPNDESCLSRAMVSATEARRSGLDVTWTTSPVIPEQGIVVEMDVRIKIPTPGGFNTQIPRTVTCRGNASAGIGKLFIPAEVFHFLFDNDPGRGRRSFRLYSENRTIEDLGNGTLLEIQSLTTSDGTPPDACMMIN